MKEKCQKVMSKQSFEHGVALYSARWAFRPKARSSRKVVCAFQNWNFGKLEFWKIGILEIAFGGGGGLRQNSILSVAQKSIETQYKYRNKIQTK